MESIVIQGHKVARDGGRLTRLEARLNELPPFRTVRGWENEWDDPGTFLVSPDPIETYLWPVYLAITVEPYWSKTWKVELVAISPVGVRPQILDAAAEMLGLDLESMPQAERLTASLEALANFGAAATLSSFYTEVPKSGVLAAQAESIGAVVNLNGYLDVHVNQTNDTGWDVIQGCI